MLQWKLSSLALFLVMVLGQRASFAVEEESEEAGENFSTLLYLGTGLQDLVLRTVSSCPEIFGLKRDVRVPTQNGLCQVLLRLREPRKEELMARAYYGGPAYHTSGFEPMTMLAGLAFLAFLLQTLHALLYRNPPTSSLTPVSISRASKETEPHLAHTVMSALDKYETLNEERGFHTDMPWTWASLPARLGNIIMQYWQSRSSTSCMHNILCRLLHRHKRR